MSERAGRRAIAGCAAAMAVAVTALGCDGGSSRGKVKSAGSLVVPAAAGTACPAGDPGRLAGTRVARASGSPAGPAARGPFYVDSESSAAVAARGDAVHARDYRTIAERPIAFAVGDWLPDLRASLSAYLSRAAAAHATAVLMIYAIPHRDAGAGYSAGGVPDAAAYREFTRSVAGAIGARRTVLILEPDSLAQMDSLTGEQQAERYGLLRDAVDVYAKLPATSVYLDGANCGWTPAPVMAERLTRAGVARARGFAVNVANYYWRPDEIARGRVISALTGGSHFVVDTSRNGRGPVAGGQESWCNPPGRGLGRVPTTDTGDQFADAYLWIKAPGESDGDCGRGNPPAGRFWPRQALELARNAAS